MAAPDIQTKLVAPVPAAPVAGQTAPTIKTGRGIVKQVLHLVIPCWFCVYYLH